MDLDKWISQVRGGEYLPEAAIKKLCRHVCNILCEESNVQTVSTPVIVCGDIHGQFYDLLKLFETGGEVDDGTKYIFLGDFVDRGHNSIEVLTLLLLLKARWPDRMTLLRGNHESRQVTTIYGFWDECHKKYGGTEVWRCCTEVFDCLSIAALVDCKVFCVHGGLSPTLRTIDQIRSIHRKTEIPHEGSFSDLMWSDPDEQVDDWTRSPRGAGWVFGARITKSFNHNNNLDLICRAHQLVQRGYKYHFKGKYIVTVWSAPNYCYRCGNLASILRLNEPLQHEFQVFRETSNQFSYDDLERPSYFL
eukprot:TRINITY_DN8355_c0_g1_i4.p1 TRINITY_DN8355_c0_g1~~TRINITY_DN8355_c0_g1_i4.p1  ORF type:complete len:305 (+),score=17.53 TRINITY_DN8355_c0_g1_i4:206-1120(+)